MVEEENYRSTKQIASINVIYAKIEPTIEHTWILHGLQRWTCSESEPKEL